jgi:hypothetical protein
MFFSLLNQVSAFSILVACIIGMARFAKILPVYRPFLFFIWISGCNEIISLTMIYIDNNNILNSNLYALVEYGLLLLVFYSWNEPRTRNRYTLFFVCGLVVWLIDNIIIHSLSTINSSFRVFYSIVILFLSINQLNKLIVFEKKSLSRNAIFLACMGFCLYFSYKAFIETFYLFEMPFSNPFYGNLFSILLLINLFTNLIYAIAVLCMPTKREFTLPL